jgi:hypothetical protein
MHRRKTLSGEAAEVQDDTKQQQNSTGGQQDKTKSGISRGCVRQMQN